jgi:hypothetical protein
LFGNFTTSNPTLTVPCDRLMLSFSSKLAQSDNIKQGI